MIRHLFNVVVVMTVGCVVFALGYHIPQALCAELVAAIGLGICEAQIESE